MSTTPNYRYQQALQAQEELRSDTSGPQVLFASEVRLPVSFMTIADRVLSYEQPIRAFFAHYRANGFYFNQEEPINNNFARLGDLLTFDKDARKITRRALRDAYIEQFGLGRGDGPKGLMAWQNLARRLELPAQTTVDACREVGSMRIYCYIAQHRPNFI